MSSNAASHTGLVPTTTALGRQAVVTKVVRDAVGSRSRPWLTTCILLCSDLLALLVAGIICVKVRHYFGGAFHPSLYWQLWPILALFVLGFGAVKLYPGSPLSPPEEIRRVFQVSSIVYLALGTMTFFGRGGSLYSRLIFLSAWALSIVLVLLFRAAVRFMFAPRPWWGHSAVVLGAGSTGRAVVKLLLRQPEIGLKPVAMLDDLPRRRTFFGSVPILGGLDLVPQITGKRRNLYAILAMPDLPNQNVVDQLEQHEHAFSHLIVIPDVSGITTLGVAAQDLGGMLGLEIRQRLLDPGRLAIKRGIELLIILIFSPLILLLTLLIALVVKIDSRGPIFYGHERIGMGGRRFKAWKFRSMVRNANEVLEKYLQQHPELRREWERTQKLKDDPRVTRVGRFLRRTSLDELPQIWNVICGEMSLVGPRPIIEQEVPRYGKNLKLYLRVRPGLTGLWQVSGRNNLTYAERVRMDIYYVRNWSVWLDLHLLTRTAMPVMFGEGAY